MCPKNSFSFGFLIQAFVCRVNLTRMKSLWVNGWDSKKQLYKLIKIFFWVRKNTAIFDDKVTKTLANFWKWTQTQKTKERLCPSLFVCNDNFLIYFWSKLQCLRLLFQSIGWQNILQIFCWCDVSWVDQILGNLRRMH